MIDPSLLLEREEFELDSDLIPQIIKGKTVLVTGAGGSIGSEICRQIILLEPKRLLLFGRGENSLYQIERELASSDTEIIGIIGDIQNKTRVETVFSKYFPNIVYHAAASKHVPLMENNPTEAVLNNIIGTKNLADIADKYKTESFVMISTDKAVKPTSVMGASKRIAELLVQSMNKDSSACFSIVRFGNVLGSRGSVVPLFQEQIDRGGPITITHKEMTRYFMTIPEASKLVIQAGVFATGGEIFVLDMGQPVKIVDLAEKMIRLSGKSLEDIEIIEVGIRPGEKIHEELMSKNETVSDQVLPKTFVSTSTPRNKEEILSVITSLFGLDSLNLKRSLVYEANQF
jgi:UDP-N-acetylglucosamine 4,6-dehydratase